MAILKVANTHHDASGFARTQTATANTIAWVTSNSERVRLDPSGNLTVGRGTALSDVGQSVKVDINGAINVSALLINGTVPVYGATLTADSTSTTRYVTFASSTSGTMQTAYVSSSGLTFNPGTRVLTINGSNVGNNAFRSVVISTSTPSGGTSGDIWYQV